MKTLQLHMLILGIVLSASSLKSQELISAAAGHANVNNHQISWSLGETMTETMIAGDIVLTQGFHQDFYQITTVFETEDASLKLDVYPNPTTQYLHLRKTENSNPVRYYLYDLSGKLMKTGLIHQGDYTLDLRAYQAGNFILRLHSSEGELLKSYQIVKVK